MARAPFHAIQPTFAGGEFSPALYARVDIQKYLSGLRTARNVTILPQGGAKNRPGTIMVAPAGDSTNPVRVIPFVAATDQAYTIELGEKYARFFTQDAQVQNIVAPAWATATPYVVGDYVTFGGLMYYCKIAHTSGVFAVDLLAGDWNQQTAYEIPTPWSAADIFKLKIAQSADQLFVANPSYAPQVLTFTSATNWSIAPYSFINGPFMVENTDITSTITPTGLYGSITMNASKPIFNAGHVNALWQLVSTIVGQTITPQITTAVVSFIPTATIWNVVTTGTWFGTIFVQTSPDNITWTTVQTYTSNGSSNFTSGNVATGFALGYVRVIIDSAKSFSGSVGVTLTGDGSTATGNITAITDIIGPASCGTTATITTTGVWTGTISLDKSTDGGTTWTSLATYTTNQTGTNVATGSPACLIRVSVSSGGWTGTAAVTLTGNNPQRVFTLSSSSVSGAIQCGASWAAITTGGWTGKLRIEVSVDGGNNWSLVQTFQSSGNDNYNTSGETGFSQCLLRVSSDSTQPFSGTAEIDLTSSSFNWVGVVKITAFTSTTQVIGTVQKLSNTINTGLANTSSTWQWSEGAWSTYRGFPSAVTFYLDRLVWAGPQPANLWLTKTSAYNDFGISFPLADSDGINIVLNSRTLNAIQSIIPMPQVLVVLTSDSEFSVAPGQNGVLGPTSVEQQLQGHRGSADIDPAIVGIELLLIQQMGTVCRNLIFQLAVNGFFGDNVSITAQHLFTGFSIIEMAYAQEPDSIVYFIRNDGSLLSLTYQRDQEMQAWTHHDTAGSFESVCVIPNSQRNFNEPWFVVNRVINGVQTRFIERFVNRDGMGTNPADQHFVDCGLTYIGSPSNTFTGADHLNGASVSVLADGNVVADGGVTLPALTVVGGTLTLPDGLQASKVHVGLPFTSDVELLRIESPQQDGTLQGRRSKIPRMKARVWNTRGLYAAIVSNENPAPATGINGLDELQPRPQVTHWDAPIALATRDFDIAPISGYDYGSRPFFRQIAPLPFTLLAVMPNVIPGGD